jgi:hypothetical protein
MVEAVQLNNGVRVLGRVTKYGLNAVTYANRTQAHRRADELRATGIACHVIGRRPFYVALHGGPPNTGPDRPTSAGEVSGTAPGPAGATRPNRSRSSMAPAGTQTDSAESRPITGPQPAGRTRVALTSPGEVFALSNPRRVIQPERFGNLDGRQGKPFAGFNCLPGQTDLFQTDGTNGDSSEK